ncbi:hypothetical protein CONPUDRAFT_54600, partial [Coniophora puteana RWD-64-598 SS2]
TRFEPICNEEAAKGLSPYGPFRDQAEWDLSRWLMQNVTQTAADDFLKLDIVSFPTSTQIFTSSYTWLKKMDDLHVGPDGRRLSPEWQCIHVSATGDKRAEDDKPEDDTFEMWMRDPVEAVCELIGNPALKDHLAYAPERVYTDAGGQNRKLDEMWTGNWWWETQARR